ncbi:hypothetical protein HDV02_002952 [Globomyces sp. JEL0801]|nr:hypothetical protein HDV02_002952 [Globomyces sp. JEL0801]
MNSKNNTYDKNNHDVNPFNGTTAPSNVAQNHSLDAHRDLLHLEADFQTRFHRWLDEQTLDLGYVIDLKTPLDALIELFESFQIPKDTNNEQDFPSFHVESTLAILKSLLSNYDNTMGALYNARKSIGCLESKQLIHKQFLNQWSDETIKVLHGSRNVLMKQHQLLNFQKSEKELLKYKFERCEQDRQTKENLILSLVNKLNDKERELLQMDKNQKKLNFKILNLKTQLQQLTKWKQHMNNDFIFKFAKDEQLHQSKTRQRSLEYSNSVETRNRMNLNNNTNTNRSRSNSMNRFEHDTNTKSRSRSRSRTKSQTKVKKNDTQPLMNKSEQINQDFIDDIMKALMEKKKKFKRISNTNADKMNPAKSILLSKLKEVDGEINELAKDLLL